VEAVVAAGDAAERLGIEPGMVVQELGWDEDVDDGVRAAIEERIRSDLLDEDADEVVDVVLLWWREDDGDLVDVLMDVMEQLADDGVIWVLTPKTRRDGHVEPSEIAEAVPLAGLTQASSVSAGPDWTATRLVSPVSAKASVLVDRVGRQVTSEPRVQRGGAEGEYRDGRGYIPRLHSVRGVPSVDRTTITTFPVSIYLSDESTHDAVETAVVSALASAGASIVAREEPIVGSWFRRMRAAPDAVRELGATAAHAADSRLVLGHDAHVTATLMQHLGPVITALQPTKEAVIRLGAVLIIKLDGQLVIHQLTAAQQLRLDHEPHLALAPHDILAALELPRSQRQSSNGSCPGSEPPPIHRNIGSGTPGT
jgi:hypothetical protein